MNNHNLDYFWAFPDIELHENSYVIPEDIIATENEKAIFADPGENGENLENLDENRKKFILAILDKALLEIAPNDVIRSGLTFNFLSALLRYAPGWIDEGDAFGYGHEGDACVSDLLTFLELYPHIKTCGYILRDADGQITSIRLVGVLHDSTVTKHVREDFQRIMGFAHESIGWHFEAEEEFDNELDL